jgi:hypothetical protein
MARDWLNAEIARQRQDELRRSAERNADSDGGFSTRRVSAHARPQEAVTLRLAAADDGHELDTFARVSLRLVARISRGLLPR